MDWEKIKPGLWGAIVGAIILSIIGFVWGGWVTTSTAQKMADEKAEDAVVDRLASICVVQFNQDPEKDQKFKELKEINSYMRPDYVEKQVWAIMPGETKQNQNREVAEACAEKLMQLGQ